MKNKLLLFVFVLIVKNAIAINYFSPIKISTNDQSKNITGDTWYFEDSTREYQIEDIQKNFDNLHFKKSRSPQTNFGQTKSYYWFLIPVSNQSNVDKEFIIQINNPKITRIGLYRMNPSGKFELMYFTGCSPYVFDNRPIHYRSFSFPITLKNNDTTTYLLFVDKSFQQLLVSLFLSPNNSFFKETMANYLWMGIYSGVLLSIVLFNLFLFLSVRQKIHLYYSALIISTGLWVYADLGFGFQYIWPNSPSFNHIACSLLSMIALAFWILCIKFFLLKPAKDKHSINFLYVIVWYDILLAVIIIVAAFFEKAVAIFPNYLIAHSIAVFLSVIYIFVLLFRDLFRKHKPIYILLPAFIMMSSTTVVKQLILSGYINGSEFLNRGILVGHITEFITLTILLSIYYQDLKKKNSLLQQELSEQQSRYLENLVKAQEEERKHIAQNLHDELGGSLSAIKVNMSAIQIYDEYKSDKFTSIIKMVDNACAQLRTISHNLMPIILVQLGFEKAIHSLIEKLNNNDKINFELFIDLGNHKLKESIEISVYRMINELINNVLKHSNASNAMLQIFSEENNCIIIMEDDGDGFDSTIMHEGIGISNIKSRIAVLNGTLVIDSYLKKGTTIIISIPFKGD